MITISPAVADEVKFLASAPKQVIQGQQFQVVYTLQNAGGDGFRARFFGLFRFIRPCYFTEYIDFLGEWKNIKNQRVYLYLHTEGRPKRVLIHLPLRR